MRPARIEGFCLAALAAYVVSTDTTITQLWRRLRRHPVGLLALGAASGAALVHLWLED